MNLKEAYCQSVWTFFHQLSQIPRPSGNCLEVATWLIQIAQKYKWQYRQDAVGNLFIEVPSSPGYEGHAPVVLQSHMDMVCQKTPDSNHDFNRDPIKLREHNGWISAENTTLGADNGLGLCLALAAGIDKNIQHPPLELLFTIDEETGLVGAMGLNKEFVKANRMINLDSEHDSSIFIGCAGGELTDMTLAFQRFDNLPSSCAVHSISISGLTGGHSGVDIHRQRANALSMMGFLLDRLTASAHNSIHLIDISGGTVHNAIARDCQVCLAIDTNEIEDIQKAINQFETEIKRLYADTDPNIRITLKPSDNHPADLMPVALEDLNRMISLICAIPNGVYRVDNQLGMIETSSNLAIVKIADNELHIQTSQRSSNPFSLDWITARINSLAKLAGGQIKNSNRYPGWNPNLESDLLKRCQKVYQKLFKKEAQLVAIHAGLECGIIGERIKGMDMISFGPNIEGAHSPTERVEIASVDKIWLLLTSLLSQL